jgi:hypothetical protein
VAEVLRTALVRVLSRPSSWMLIAAAAIAAADAAIIGLGFRGDFAYDFECCYQQAGQRLLDGRDIYDWSATYTFRYSPWAAAVFVALAPLSVLGAILAWLAVKIVALGAAATWFARAWPAGRRRTLVTVLVLAFPPAIHDLMIGNVSVFTLLVLVAVLRAGDRVAGGSFGLLLLLAPKPHLLPIAAWLVFRRPRAGLAMLATLGGGLALGIPLFGLDRWLGYLATFREPLGREFTANIGFSALFGPIGVAIGLLAAAVVVTLALRRRAADGLSLSILAGIVLGPYTFIHYLSGLVVSIEPLLRRRPALLAPAPLLLLVFPLMPVWLLLLAAVQYRTSEAATRTAPRGVTASAGDSASPAPG